MDQELLIRSLREENAALRQQVKELTARINRDLFARSIRDEHLSLSLTKEMSRFFEAPLAPWYVCVLFFGINPSRHEFPPESPLDTIIRTFSETLESYGQPYFFEAAGTVACFLNVELEEDAEESPESGNAFCRELQEALTQTFSVHHRQASVSHIVISRASRMEQGPRVLYRSAVSVSERRTAASPPVCIEEGFTTSPREPLKQVFSLEPLFWRQIQQRAFFDAAATLDELIQLTSLEQGSLDRTLASVFSRMELVLQTMVLENGGDPTRDPEFTTLLPALSNAETYQEMREAAYDILATLEDRFYTPPNARNKKMANVETYISKNYADPMLCATSIAEEFKISPSYLSRIFKADKGVGIVEFIHRTRIDAAKGLLRDENLTIDAVAVKVGFSNRWVLTRVFKKLTGVTPGAYRSGMTF